MNVNIRSPALTYHLPAQALQLRGEQQLLAAQQLGLHAVQLQLQLVVQLLQPVQAQHGVLAATQTLHLEAQTHSC